MDSGSLVSPRRLMGDGSGVQAALQIAGLRNGLAYSGSMATPDLSTRDRNAHTNRDLRPVVARRFMRMLRLHDRARMELLAAHPAPPR